MVFAEVFHHDSLFPFEMVEDGSVRTCVTSPPYWGVEGL